jgi:AcrR family transcriptional regulator
VLNAASDLFAQHAVPQVSLRDIAHAANVQVALIARYIGSRDDLLDAVFDELSADVARWVVDHPLEQVSFEVVGESGIHHRSDVERLEQAGVEAMLVGESLMACPDIGSTVRKLLGR